MNKKLLVGITCTENDFSLYKANLKKSLLSFYEKFNDNVSFLIVFQGTTSDDQILFFDLPKSLIEIKEVAYRSVSKARNEIIEYFLDGGYENLIFHDVSLVFLEDYLSWIMQNLGSILVSGNMRFNDSPLAQNISICGRVIAKYKPIQDLYVCAFVFSSSLKLPRFDENYGPGENTIYKCGEDLLFMMSLMKLNPNAREFPKFEGIGVLHPARSGDYSKHLEYAEGQGKVYKILLVHDFNFLNLYQVMLFFSNALFRLITLKKNSPKILFLRIKGFFS